MFATKTEVYLQLSFIRSFLKDRAGNEAVVIKITPQA